MVATVPGHIILSQALCEELFVLLAGTLGLWGHHVYEVKDGSSLFGLLACCSCHRIAQPLEAPVYKVGWEGEGGTRD